jgi:hypothetical protein
MNDKKNLNPRSLLRGKFIFLSAATQGPSEVAKKQVEAIDGKQ